jgi:hypothetical protein
VRRQRQHRKQLSRCRPEHTTASSSNAAPTTTTCLPCLPACLLRVCTVRPLPNLASRLISLRFSAWSDAHAGSRASARRHTAATVAGVMTAEEGVEGSS